MYLSPLFLKLSSIYKLLILTKKLLVNIKTQSFYSCLILTENFLVNIKTQNFYSCLILTENFLGNIKTPIDHPNRKLIQSHNHMTEQQKEY